MLISPTERPPISRLGKFSSIPESFGSDILLYTRTRGVVGIQRKELTDLVSSVYDGRLGKELDQMKLLGLGILLIEGTPQWTDDGYLLSTQTSWSRSQFLGLIWSVQSRGFWVNQSSSPSDTCTFASLLEKWLTKDRHTQLNRRPNPKGVWGKADNKDWALHLLQSFPGVGYDRAEAIYKHFEGVPLTWTVTAMDLQQVSGIGKGTAERLIEALAVSNPLLSESSLLTEP